MNEYPLRVLLIDDDEDDYIATRRLLAQIGERRFTLEWAATYDEALTKIKHNEHDVYLLDHYLGERKGLTLLNEARAHGCTAPFSMLTGTGDRAVDLAAMQAGAADYLEKDDLSTAVLERALRYALERRRLQMELRQLTLTDPLTGLYSRRGFLTVADQQLKAMARAQRGVVFLFADLDGLKQINDTFGHEEGDAALLQTAALLKQTFRESDIIARLGGDEFVVLAAEVAPGDDAVLVARLQRQFEKYNTQGKHPYQLSPSVGVVSADSLQPLSLEELMSRADQRLYGQKRARKRLSL